MKHDDNDSFDDPDDAEAKMSGNGGIYPFGYVASERSGVPRIEESEAVHVRDLFEKCAEGWELGRITDLFANKGVKTRVVTVKKRGGTEAVQGGVPFRTDRLRALVRNPMYKGMVVHGDVTAKGLFPALLPEALWAAANKKLDEREDNGSERP
jgi:hypothetical protein